MLREEMETSMAFARLNDGEWEVYAVEDHGFRMRYPREFRERFGLVDTANLYVPATTLDGAIAALRVAQGIFTLITLSQPDAS